MLQPGTSLASGDVVMFKDAKAFSSVSVDDLSAAKAANFSIR